MNKKLIKKLRKGTIAVENDGNLEGLRKVLKCAFSNNVNKIVGDSKYYFKSSFVENFWGCDYEIDLPTHSVKEFLTQEKEKMSTIVNINPDTLEINITPKEGFEIDLENSDLKNGKVLFKEAEKKYPSDFIFNQINGELEESYLSKKYAEKLDTLDTLLCLRDEYNRIDGFTEGFGSEIGKYCIENFNGKVQLSESCYTDKIMHFGKEETAGLFLKNFEEQLEQIKEFL